VQQRSKRGAAKPRFNASVVHELAVPIIFTHVSPANRPTETAGLQISIIDYLYVIMNLISPTHKRTEGRAPVWGSEFTSKLW
jgi:hypothetical protein